MVLKIGDTSLTLVFIIFKVCIICTDPTKALLLEWPFRYNIALGMAKGLAYLHSKGDRQQRLAHGDIKASSILLDRRLEPKIADFGLARLCQMNSRKVLTRIDGKRWVKSLKFVIGCFFWVFSLVYFICLGRNEAPEEEDNEVDVPSLITDLYRTSIFEWYAIRCGSKNW